VSEACRLCYAETFSHRLGKDIWGKDKPRRFFGDKHWNEPLKWNRNAQKEGRRYRVFCASMADWLEEREDLIPHQTRLLNLIKATPNLDWLLLTKRIEAWENVLHEIVKYDNDGPADEIASHWLDGKYPENVWMGITTETQEWCDKRIPELLRIPARVRWLSIEPLLGPVDLRSTWFPREIETGQTTSAWREGINWVIVGGESGHDAKAMDPEWVQKLIQQCSDAEVAFHFKQKGQKLAREWHCASSHGSDPKEWPKWMRIQEFPDRDSKGMKLMGAIA
jgi:protein gp37